MLRTGPVLIKVSEEHQDYKSGTLMSVAFADNMTYQTIVESKFKASWRYRNTCPEVRAVYKIINTEASVKKYEEYLYASFHVLSDPAFFLLSSLVLVLM